MDIQSRSAVLVTGRSNDVLSAAKAAAGSHEVHVAPDLESLRQMLRAEVRGRWRAIVYELAPHVPSREAAEAAELLSTASCPVILGPRFGRGFGVSAQRLALRRTDVVVALDCAEDLVRMTKVACAGATLRSATGRVIAEIGPYVPSMAQDCFAVTAVLGGTTCTRERVAKAAGVPLGTVEHHLRSVNALTVRLQLRWRRSVRVVFRMCELGETEAEAAESAGWDSRTACAHAVRACTGLAPADWRRAGGFPAMLSAYCRVWESRCAGWIARTRQ